MFLRYANDVDLSRHITRKKNNVDKKGDSYWNAGEVVDMFSQITDGLVYLHSKHIIHRDLKPQNILRHLRQNIIILKISDFGLSAALPDMQDYAKGEGGTAAYMSKV